MHANCMYLHRVLGLGYIWPEKYIMETQRPDRAATCERILPPDKHRTTKGPWPRHLVVKQRTNKLEESS